jgi:hypothetical protein
VLIVRRLLGVLGLGPAPDARDVEIAVLRHQLSVLGRQVARQEVAVPTQDGVWTHQQPHAGQRGPGESIQHRGHEGPIGRREADFVGSELALQQGDLVAQHQDFRVLILIAHRQ